LTGKIETGKRIRRQKTVDRRRETTERADREGRLARTRSTITSTIMNTTKDHEEG
jgi:hypothetical protein